MNHTRMMFLLLSVLMLHCTFGRAQGNTGGLLAAPYPGAVVATNPAVGDAWSKAIVDARSSTFYTKDPMEKVMAHYAKSLGEFSVSPAGDHIYVHDVIPFSEVVGIVEKKGASVGEGGESFYGGAFAGVTLHGKVTNGNYHYSVLKVFESLLNAYLLRFQEADPAKLQAHLEDPELKTVQARYEHLKWSYFQRTSEKRKDGVPGNLSMDEVLFDKYFVAPEEARAKEIGELQKKMTELSTQMKYDEATKVGDRMMKLMTDQQDPKALMDNVMKCFQEMDKHAYATMIVIDHHPSTWDLTPPKN